MRLLIVKMELQCDACIYNFDLDTHRPKSLPCGHTICKRCVQSPALEKKCPTCKKDLGGDPADLPDTIVVVRLIEQDAPPPLKKPKTEDTAVPQLQRGVDVGRKVVEQLRQVVPLALEVLNRTLDSSVAQLRQMEKALEQQVRREEADDAGVEPDLIEQLQLAVQLQLAAQLENSLCLLTTSRCGIEAEGDGGATWRASVDLGGLGDVLRLLLLQLHADGQLEKVVNSADDVADVTADVTTPAAPVAPAVPAAPDAPVGPAAPAVPAVRAAPATPAAPRAYVGPPLISTLRIQDYDYYGGRLLVNDILRDQQRVRDTRSVRGLQGEGSDLLLRVLAQEQVLEELEISDVVTLGIMEELLRVPSLKRLDVNCDEDLYDYPALPLQLEELWINQPNETQLRSVEDMPRLRSFAVNNYFGPNLIFAPSRFGTLLWLGVTFNTVHKSTMLSLIRSHASSVQELRLVCSVSGEGAGEPWFFPDLGQELVASGLHALRRLVLERPFASPCTSQVAACLLHRKALRRVLPPSIEVVCRTCWVSEL